MFSLYTLFHSYIGASSTKFDGVRSWKRDALRMMQPPSGIKDLYHDDFDLSPSTALSSPESTAHTALSDKVDILNLNHEFFGIYNLCDFAVR